MSIIDSVTQHLIAGTIAGVVSTSALYPLDLIKTRMQVTNRSSPTYHGVFSTVTTVIRQEGFGGLYKGVTPAVLASAGSWGGYFYLYEMAKKRRLKDRESSLPGERIAALGNADHFLAGTEAGIAMVLVFNPLWVVRTRLAIQGANLSSEATTYKGMVDAFRTIWREEGIRGLYKGLFPALLLTSHGSIQFTAYEAMKNWVEKFNSSNDPTYRQNSQSAIMSMLLGGASKIFASCVTYPYQVVKSRLQMRQPIPNDVSPGWRYSRSWECVKSIYVQEGVLGFFRGIIPNAVKVAPSAALTFLVYEESMKAMKPSRNS